MRPVDQTKFMDTSADGRGDCLRACVASILELPIEAVPDFSADGSYTIGAIAWLQARGYQVLSVQWSGDGYDHSQYLSCPQGYAVLGGKSPRTYPDGSRAGHAVVGRANGWNFRIDHDPHPSRAGIVGQVESVVWIFRPLETDGTYTVTN